MRLALTAAPAVEVPAPPCGNGQQWTELMPTGIKAEPTEVEPPPAATAEGAVGGPHGQAAARRPSVGRRVRRDDPCRAGVWRGRPPGVTQRGAGEGEHSPAHGQGEHPDHDHYVEMADQRFSHRGAWRDASRTLGK